MNTTIAPRLSSAREKLAKALALRDVQYGVSLVYLVVSILFIYSNPRSQVASLLAFLMFVSSVGLLVYFPKIDRRVKIGLGVFIALVVVPVLGVRNIFYLEVFLQISMYAALALGLNVVVDFAGLLNLGYVAFFAVGAYLWAFFGSQQMYLLNEIPGSAPPNTPFYLPPDTFYLFLFLAVIVGALMGLLLGLPVLRLRGDYLAIVTLGFGEVIRVLANNMDRPLNITNGPQGITPIQRPTLPQFLLDAFNSVLSPVVGKNASVAEFYNLYFYIAALVVIIIVITVARRLDDSKMGRAWTAIREDELAAVSMGIPIVRLKLAAFAVGASFAGIMGVMFAASRTFVSPESFSFMQSIGVLSMVILGGLGSIQGVVVGAVVIIILNLQILPSLSLELAKLRQSDAVIPIINFAWKNLSTQLDPAKYQRMVFGLILVLMMIYRPDGLIPAKRRARELERKKTEPPIEVKSSEEGKDGSA
jgi:branched-chain amino acid transport system permease protein